MAGADASVKGDAPVGLAVLKVGSALGISNSTAVGVAIVGL